MSEFKPMIKMDTTEPSVELKLKKGGSAHHKHHEHAEHHKAGKKVVKKAMGGLPTAGMAVPAAGVTGRRMNPRVAALMQRNAMATPMMKKGGKASEAELKKLHAELKKHEHMKAGKAHHGLKKGGLSTGDLIPSGTHEKKHGGMMHKAHGGTTGYAIPADTHKKRGGKVHHHYAKGGKVAGRGEGELQYEKRVEDPSDSIGHNMTRTTIKGDERQYLETLMHTAVPDRGGRKTGMVKEGNAGGYKKGGKVHHKEHGEHDAHHHLMKAHHHMTQHAEGGSAHHKRMMAHHMRKAEMCMSKHAAGGTIEGNEGKYLETLMHQAVPDHAHGTGMVKESNAGGYKRGGKVHEEARGKFGTDAVRGDRPLVGHRASVSSETKAQPHQWEFDNVVSTKPGVRAKTTGEVREGNAGGYKHGGRPVKKHYATGGSVNDTGKPVAMKQGRKPASPFVSINELSGTFKKGGKVKKYDGGGSTGTDTPPPDVADAYQTMRENRAYNNFMQNKATEKSQPDFLDNVMSGIKNYMFGAPTPPAGSVTKTTKSITVSPKKRGGRAK